jgi:DNA-binding MarR family transcriptional regulator
MSTVIEEALIEQVRDSVMPLVARVDRVANDWLGRQLSELGVSISDFRLIGALLGEKEGLPQNILAKRLRIEPATLSVALAKLEAKGVVVRYPDAQDSRIRRVMCSKRGARFGEIKVLLERLERSALEGLDTTAIVAARDVLAKMEKNLLTLAGPPAEGAHA